MRGPPDQIKSEKRSTASKLLLTAAFLTGVVGVNVAATQYVASKLNYHPALGSPLVGNYYWPLRWVQWRAEPWAAPHEQTFGVAGAIASGPLMFGILGVFMVTAMRRRKPKKHEGLYGTAAFAKETDINDSGLLPRKGSSGSGVYVGGWSDPKGQLHYLRHDGPEHVAIIAPTRSGKGVGLVIPTLLSWPASVVCYDEKGELWELSAGWRKEGAGNTVIRWEPGAAEGSSSYNFLDEVRIGTAYEVGDAQNIAQMICDPQGEGLRDHWSKTSFALITGVILHMLYVQQGRGLTACLTDVAYALSSPDRSSNQLWMDMVQNTHGIDGTQHVVVAVAGRDMLDKEERERGSVLSTAKTYLTLFQDPLIARNTRRSDFCMADLMNHSQPVSLYIRVRGDDKIRLRPLIRLMLTMVMRSLTGVDMIYENGKARSPHRHRLLMLLDEFPSLGQIDVIEDGLAKCAGFGIKAYLVMQDRLQLLKAYSNYQSIISNCHIRVGYAPNEFDTARWWSDMLGTSTTVKEEFTESGERMGSLKNVSRSYSQVSGPLLTPDEVMQLRSAKKNDNGDIVEAGAMIVYPAGRRPIYGTQILYFLDPVFSVRARIPAPQTERIRSGPSAIPSDQDFPADTGGALPVAAAPTTSVVLGGIAAS